MAYGRAELGDKIKLKQILERYSHLGHRNFLTYAYKASQSTYQNSKGQTKEGIDSPAIRRQLERHMTVLKTELEKKNSQRFEYKDWKRKNPKLKIVNL